MRSLGSVREWSLPGGHGVECSETRGRHPEMRLEEVWKSVVRQLAVRQNQTRNDALPCHQ